MIALPIFLALNASVAIHGGIKREERRKAEELSLNIIYMSYLSTKNAINVQ
jgi:hypothetical protein